MDISSRVNDPQTPALTSDPRELASASVYRAYHALGPIPNLSLSFLTSVSIFLAHKPSRLRIPEPYHRTLPALQKETIPYGAPQKPQIRGNLHCP